MLTMVGIACVAWTVVELAGLIHAQAPAFPGSSAAASASSKKRSARGFSAGRGRRFRAWDDRGHSIVVEDLGRA